MFKTIARITIAASVAILPSLAFAYQLPAPTTVTTQYASGAGAVDFTQPSQVHGVFEVSNDLQGTGEYITAGDVGHGASGYGFYAYQGQLFVVASDGSFTRREFAGFYDQDTPITVSAAYNPTTHRIDFQTQSFDSFLNGTDYGYGVVLDGLPYAGALAADPLQVLLNKRDYGTTTLTVSNWSYTN